MDFSSDSSRALSSLTQLLEIPAARQPDQRAYTFLEGEASAVSVTYGELDRRARAIAARVGDHARPGETALLLYPPGIDFIAAFFGCLYSRVVAVPLPLPGVRSGSEKLQLIQADAQATLALTTTSLKDRFGDSAAPGGLRWLATDGIVEGGAENLAAPDAGNSTLAYLQYTSGSTSAPRGVMMSHANVLHNLANIDERFQHGPDSVIVTWLPHFHDMGLIYGMLAPLYARIPCYFMSPAAFIQRPVVWLRAISRYGGTHGGGPNFAYDLCARRISAEEGEALDLSSWEVAFNGAEPVHAETLDRFTAAFSPCGFRRSAFCPAYGLAEASLKVSGCQKAELPVVVAVKSSSLSENRVEEAAPDAPGAHLMVSCGRAGLDTKIIIADPESLSLCAPGEVGEIWVSGPGVAQGYWRRPEETEQTFRAYLSDTEEGPFLRTGDLGFLRDGELFIAGRIKDLIIIRGENHYPNDIELTARRSHPELAASIGAAFSIEVSGEERLVLVQEAGRQEPPGTEEISRTVRHAVTEQHQIGVYAFVLVKKGGVPRTSSGKIQRRLCRSLYVAGKLDVVFESVLEETSVVDETAALDRDALLASPREDRPGLLASYLRSQLGRVLKADARQLDLKLPVTSYGLDSLTATELQNRVELDLGVSLPAVELLEGVSIEELAVLILEGLGGRLRVVAPIRARGGEGSPPSFEQERLWLLDQLSPGNAAYHVPFAFHMTGPLNLPALEDSVNEILKRHDSLRTAFAAFDGTPVPVVSPPLRLKIQVEELQGASEAEAMRRAGLEARKPFDLTRGPLFRFRLFRLGAEDHLALLIMHHIVSDVWSVRLFLEELLMLYQSFTSDQPLSLAPLPVQYADFVAWQRERLQGETLAHLVSWWRSHLEGAPALRLPTDRPRPDRPSFRGGADSFTFPEALSDSLRDFCRKENVTLFAVLLAAFKVLLARCTNQSDIVVGTTSANRNRPELEKLIGFFAAPLVLRTQLSGDPEFRDVLSRVRKEALDTYAHRELPFAKVVEAARPGRQSGYTPLFQVMLSVFKSLMPEVTPTALELSPVEIDTGATDFDLFVNIVEEPERLRGIVTYSRDLYDAETVQALIASCLEILETAMRDPETKLSRFPLAPALESRVALPAAAKAELVVAVTATFTAEPVEEIIAFWMRELGFQYRIRFAPYNQVFQQLLDSSSLLAENRRGVNVVLVRIEDWAESPAGVDLEKLEDDVNRFVSAVQAAAGRFASPLVVCLCPASLEFGSVPSHAEFLKRMEGLVQSGLAAASTVHVVSSSELGALYPVQDYYDSHGDRLGHVPYTPAFFTAVGTMVARRILAMRSAPHKVIVLDCDHTLWEGVCGEDGPQGVRIDPPRRALQHFMLAQHDAGMLLCLCSKNDEEDVLETFRCHPEMPLRRKHFVAWRINWDSKSENLRALADELQLGLDSFIFVDDSPAECAEVEANCPEVLTLQLPPEPDRIPKFLDHVWAFDHLRVTEEDRKRTALYGQRVERRKLRKQAVTLEEFLAALELEIRIERMSPEQLPRVSQLTQRTNQMNLTTIRRSEGTIQELLQKGKMECLTVDVKDRFGSYGLVGVVLLSADSEELEVDTFLLSCRALGRGVEHRMLARLGEIALERGLDGIRAPFVRTARNRPALDFLKSVGLAFEEPVENGFLYRFPADYAAGITYSPRGKPAEDAADRAASKPFADRAPVDYRRIANELSDAEGILEQVRAEGRSDAVSTVPYEAPRTPLEKQLAEIWAEMLAVPQVGVNDNFFDLGGHSLLAVQLLSRVRETFNVDLSLDVVFAGVFSVAELAKAIEVYEIEQAGAGEYAAILKELEGLSDEEVRALIQQEQNGEGSGNAS